MVTLDEKLDVFFKDPTIAPAGTNQGVLYLLRREIQDSLIGKVVSESQVVTEALKKRHRLFLTVMAISSGVDLLAKFHAGSDEVGGVRERLASFTKRYMFADKADPQLYADVFYYGVRNPLVHSFCMYNNKFLMTLVSGKMQQGALWKNRHDPKHFILVVEGLFVSFVQAVQQYRKDLETDTVWQANFETMFEDYGMIPMFSAWIEPFKETAQSDGDSVPPVGAVNRPDSN